MTVVEGMQNDDNFIEKCGMSRERLKIILATSAEFALWKHGLIMRFQWVLQFAAIFCIWKILCLL